MILYDPFPQNVSFLRILDEHMTENISLIKDTGLSHATKHLTNKD